VKHAVLEQRNRLTQIEPPSGLNADQQHALKQSIDESFFWQGLSLGNGDFCWTGFAKRRQRVVDDSR